MELGLVIFNCLLTIVVAIDATKRKAGAVKWCIGTLLLAPIIAPLYFANRPLKPGEERQGGKAWNFLKNFALYWTIFMAICAFSFMVFVGSSISESTSEAEQVGMAIGGTLGMTFLAFAWFFPLCGSLVLGLLLRKGSHVETGPTVGGAAAILLILAIFTGCKKADDSAESQEAIKISAPSLSSAYKSNEVSADGKYKGLLLEVGGVIEEIGKNFITEEPTIRLEGAELLHDVRCQMRSDQIDILAKLSKGEYVSIRGKCKGLTLTQVTLDDCVVVEPAMTSDGQSGQGRGLPFNNLSVILSDISGMPSVVRYSLLLIPDGSDKKGPLTDSASNDALLIPALANSLMESYTLSQVKDPGFKEMFAESLLQLLNNQRQLSKTVSKVEVVSLSTL